MFWRIFLKVTWVMLSPCWQNIVSNVITFLNVCHNILPWEVLAYSGVPLTVDSWPRSPTNIMEQPSKWLFLCHGNASRICSSMSLRSFGPMKFISSINMYHICLSSFWNVARTFSSKGMRSFMGRWRETHIVDACIFKVVTPIGARRMIGEGVEPTRVAILSLMQFIRWDFFCSKNALYYHS